MGCFKKQRVSPYDGTKETHRLFPSARLVVVLVLFYGTFLMMFNFFTMNFSLTCMIAPQHATNGSQVNANSTYSICGGRVNSSQTTYQGRRVNWNKKEQANILSGSAWGSFVTVFFLGFFMDRFGVKWFNVAALTIYAVTSAITPICALHSWVAVFVLRLIQGPSVLVGWPTVMNVATEWFPGPERGLLLSIAGSGALLGCILSMVLAGQFCSISWGWEGSFYLCAVLNVIGIAAWILLYYPHMEDTPYLSASELAYIRRTQSKSKTKQKPVTPWKQLLLSKPILAILVFSFTEYYMFYYVGDYMPLYYTDVLGFSSSLTGLLSALPSLLQFIGRLMAGPISDLVERKLLTRTHTSKLMTAIAGILPGIFIMLVAVFGCDQKYGAVVFFSLAYFFYSFLIGGVFKSLSFVAPPFAGTITGMAQAMMYLGGTVVPYITATIIHDTFSQYEYHVAGYVTGIIGVIGACVFLIFGSADEQEWSKKSNLVFANTVTVTKMNDVPPIAVIEMEQ